MKISCLLLVFSLCFNYLFATKYYCDPANGNMKNHGSVFKPWSTLDSVFITAKKVLPGDTIFLRSGFHGSPVITGSGTSKFPIVITAEAGHFPVLKKILLQSANYWSINHLKISPETGDSYEGGDIVNIKESCSYISLRNCEISSTDSCIKNWSSGEVLARFGVGIRIEGNHCMVENTKIKQVRFGIVVSKTAVETRIVSCMVYGFSDDGIRGLADNCIFEYNTVAGSYGIDDNHDDAFQSWTTDSAGKVGGGVIKNVILRGNLFVSQVDPDQPFKQNRGMQGIGNFDGFFDHWLVEDNIVVTDMWHGISFYGACNTVIKNNIVVKTQYNVLPFSPWIAIYDHKDGRHSYNNQIFKNITSVIKESKGVDTFIDNLNILPSQYDRYFKMWRNYQYNMIALGDGRKIGPAIYKASPVKSSDWNCISKSR